MTVLTISERHVRALLELTDPKYRMGPVETVWESALSTIKALVPCDVASFQILDVARQWCAIRELDDRYGVYDGPGEYGLFWSSHCSYPQRSGDYRSVTKPTDFESRRELSTSPTGEFLRANAMRYEVMVPLSPHNGLDNRVLLWRADGRDFSERDRLLLAMVRPHLVAIRDAIFLHDTDVPPLTSRQRQLLGLVAHGLTNRQIARDLGVSEHTVRTHLENIFERLDVTSRTAAVTRARFRQDPPPDPSAPEPARNLVDRVRNLSDAPGAQTI
jgi:DNA-binding CsgD family transcriptional regulator